MSNRLISSTSESAAKCRQIMGTLEEENTDGPCMILVGFHTLYLEKNGTVHTLSICVG